MPMGLEVFEKLECRYKRVLWVGMGEVCRERDVYIGKLEGYRIETFWEGEGGETTSDVDAMVGCQT